MAVKGASARSLNGSRWRVCIKDAPVETLKKYNLSQLALYDITADAAEVNPLNDTAATERLQAQLPEGWCDALVRRDDAKEESR